MPGSALFSRVAAGLAASLALGLIGGLPAAGVVPTSPATAAPTDTAPLSISLDEIEPGTIPRRGPLVVEGTVTNVSDEAWSDVKLYPFFNEAEPITTTTELAAAAATDVDAVVGERIVDVQDVVGDLDPGESATYRLRVPRSFLPVDAPGIYWFGVHALGESESTGRDHETDGRARTFLPYLPPGTKGSVDTAVVVPLRGRLSHTLRGAVAREDVWRTTLSSGGTLSNTLSFGEAAGYRPISWLVDPALPDAVQQLANGNPVRSVGPTQRDEDDPSGSASPDQEPSDDADEDQQEPSEEDTATSLAAQAWLERARSALNGEDVLTLPYGDLDVAAAARNAPALYDLARERSGSALTDWSVDATPAVASPSGYLSAEGIDVVDDDALVLLTDRMFGARRHPAGAPALASVDGRRSLVTSYAASTGGPGPDPRTDPVAMRQRLLSEAAVRMLGDRRPLVVVVPQGLAADRAAQFWEGLDVGWLHLTTAADIARRTPKTVTADDLEYPAHQRDLEMPPGLFDQVDRLRQRGGTLQNLLTLNETIADRLSDEALSEVGYPNRVDPTDSATRLRDSTTWVDKRLEAVRISVPTGVTLSSDSGAFVVTLTNNLKQPVTVRLVADGGDGATVEDVDPVEIAPGTRTSVQIHAHTTSASAQNVRLTLTDSQGAQLGATAVVPVRSGRVSDVIWLIIGAGAGILFVAIAIRLYRRITGRDTRHESGDDSPDDDTDHTDHDTDTDHSADTGDVPDPADRAPAG